MQLVHRDVFFLRELAPLFQYAVLGNRVQHVNFIYVKIKMCTFKVYHVNSFALIGSLQKYVHSLITIKHNAISAK